MAFRGASLFAISTWGPLFLAIQSSISAATGGVTAARATVIRDCSSYGSTALISFSTRQLSKALVKGSMRVSVKRRGGTDGFSSQRSII